MGIYRGPVVTQNVEKTEQTFEEVNFCPFVGARSQIVLTNKTTTRHQVQDTSTLGH